VAVAVDDDRAGAAGADVNTEEENALLYVRFQGSGFRYQVD
jgi:hypothetical protein